MILVLYDIVDVFLRVSFMQLYERFDDVLMFIEYNERVEDALVSSDILNVENCELESEFLIEAEIECNRTRNEIFLISELALIEVVLTWNVLDVLFLNHIIFFINQHVNQMININLLVLDQFFFEFRLLFFIIELTCVIFALLVWTVFEFIVVLRFWITKNVLILMFERENKVVRIAASENHWINHHSVVNVDFNDLLMLLKWSSQKILILEKNSWISCRKLCLSEHNIVYSSRRWISFCTQSSLFQASCDLNDVWERNNVSWKWDAISWTSQLLLAHCSFRRFYRQISDSALQLCNNHSWVTSVSISSQWSRCQNSSNACLCLSNRCIRSWKF